MTKTTQPRSWTALSEAGKDLTINNAETEDIISLLFTICDNLNELYEKLSRLNYVLGRKILKHNLCKKNK